MAKRILRTGVFSNASNAHEFIYDLTRTVSQLKASSITDLTDNTTGTVATDISGVAATLTNKADDSTSSAQEASAQAILALVKDGLLELATQANTIATRIGLPTVSYNGGGTTVNGTIADVGAVTAATTGVQATETNAIFTVLNNALFNVANQVKNVANACGVAPPSISLAGAVSTVSAIDVSDTGTAADPGVSKADFDAAIASYEVQIKYLANVLNSVTGTQAASLVFAL